LIDQVLGGGEKRGEAEAQAQKDFHADESTGKWSVGKLPFDFLAANKREIREFRKYNGGGLFNLRQFRQSNVLLGLCFFAKFAARIPVIFIREHLARLKCQLVQRAKFKMDRKRGPQMKEPSHVNDGWSAQYAVV
jgi:hypothetical protein